MVCIYCKGKTSVANSRPQKRTNSIWRRRSCTVCGSVFTSLESVDLAGSIIVRRNKGVEPFSRDKLLLSVYDSLRHRKTAITDAEGLLNTILSKLYAQLTTAVIDRDDIVRITSTVLGRFDKAAATHYSAFHPLTSHKN